MIKRILLFGGIIGVVLLFFISFCNALIKESSKSFIDVKSRCTVGVVLGTAKYTHNKNENLFYRNRIKKAYELYRSGVISRIIVSGDNSRDGYDEPTQMKADLVALGVPFKKIYCDYAGFSTIDSMLRMKLVFNQRKFIVISQRFHVERAVYIARRSGIEAYGSAASDVPNWYAPYNGYREQLARVKAVLEVLMGTSPRFLGDKVRVK